MSIKNVLLTALLFSCPTLFGSTTLDVIENQSRNIYYVGDIIINNNATTSIGAVFGDGSPVNLVLTSYVDKQNTAWPVSNTTAFQHWKADNGYYDAELNPYGNALPQEDEYAANLSLWADNELGGNVSVQDNNEPLGGYCVRNGDVFNIKYKIRGINSKSSSCRVLCGSIYMKHAQLTINADANVSIIGIQGTDEGGC